MQQLTEILQAATAAVPMEYFLLPLHGGDPIYRERVYCYELYHQMRCRWPDDTPFRLNGEIDKQNHPYFRDQKQPKPDLLVHQPGIGDNYAALEIKSAGAASRKIRKDLLTLELLARRADYRRLIYLVYGAGSERDVKRVRACAAQLDDLRPIELWLHPDPTVAAFPALVLDTAQHPEEAEG